MWAQVFGGSLRDTEIYEKIRNFFSKNFTGARPRKGLEKIKFSNFFPELQINLRNFIYMPWQAISHIKKSEFFFLKISWVRDTLKICDL